jgi:hypothetical protein
VNACVGVQENNALHTNVYPNPFGTQITIELGADDQYTINVVSILGEEVLCEKINGSKAVINSENWNSGVYFITISTESGKETIRVVKQQ